MTNALPPEVAAIGKLAGSDLFEQLTSKTRADVAFEAFARATARVRRLEHEAGATFDELVTAQELLREQGVAADVELDSGIAAAFSAWKQHRARAEAREVAREVVGS